MIYPTVHRNGTAPETLIDDYLDAANAVYAAMEALAKTAPHGRDYYPQEDPGALKRATQEHCMRLERLSSVRRELLDLAGSVSDGRYL
jgi:hypothetical protein